MAAFSAAGLPLYLFPYGVLPTNTATVDAIAKAIGEERAFAEELHHRTEHSVELAAVWLHHMRDGKPCQLVPIPGAEQFDQDDLVLEARHLQGDGLAGGVNKSGQSPLQRLSNRELEVFELIGRGMTTGKIG